MELIFCGPISILNSLKNVKKIKKLDFRWSKADTSDYDVLENVDELEILTTSGFDLAVKFPNLTKINIRLCQPDAQNLKLEKFKKLKHLGLGGCTIHDLTISASTKSIKFFDYTFAVIPRFEHFQFDEIELARCKNVDWLAEFLAKDETRVKKLEIYTMEMSSIVFMAIGDNWSKVKSLIIKDIKFI